jgi:hypothetical protein
MGLETEARMSRKLRRRTIASLALVLVSAGCARPTQPAARPETLEELERAVAAAQAATSYHVRVVIDAQGEELGPLSGTYELEIEKPDRSRTIRLVNGREVQRTIVIGPHVYFSDDRGKTWEEEELDPPPIPAGTYVDLLSDICSVKGALPRLEVTVASEGGSCGDEESLPTLFVTLQSGRIKTIEETVTAEEWSLHTTGHYDFERPVEPIEVPAGG